MQTGAKHAASPSASSMVPEAFSASGTRPPGQKACPVPSHS